MNRWTCIDLFCGCGGFSLGMERAGFKCLAAIDFNHEAVEVFKNNFPAVPQVLEKDLAKFTPASLAKLIGASQVDTIVGGPPCQGFSTARQRDGANHGVRLKEDPRRYLYQEFLRYVEFFQPKVFVMENVLGIRSASGGEYFTRVQKEARAIGYRVHAQVEDCVELGLPQKRRRQLFIGTRLDLPDYFRPEIKPAPRACDLPSLMQAVAGNTIRVRRIQMLSAAFNLNTPLEVDINKTRRRLKAPKEIAHQAIELARLGQFDKIAWDGAGGKGSLAKSTQSAPIIGDENSSLSAQELIELTHIAHQAGLETYISAGMDHTHMETAVCCGVGGVGIGTRFHESVNPSTGLMGVLDKQKITSCLDNRNNAEASPAGKAAFRLKCLDWQSLEQKLSAKEQALQQQLFALLREYVGLSNAAPERLQLNSKLTQQLSQELSPVRDNKSRRARGGQDALCSIPEVIPRRLLQSRIFPKWSK